MNKCNIKIIISNENKGRASNNEVFGVKYGFEKENVFHMNKNRGVNVVA